MKNYPYSYNTMKEDYAQYCVECRWNGQQPLTFVQWACDEDEDPKAEAQERLTELWENDTWDMY